MNRLGLDRPPSSFVSASVGDSGEGIVDVHHESGLAPLRDAASARAECDATQKLADAGKRSTASCRICGCLSLTTYLTVGEETLDRCGGCGFVQVRREPSETMLREIYSGAYFAHSKYRDPRALALENTLRLAILDQILPASAEVLDAGCSTGDFVATAKSRYLIHGIDISEYAISQARTANPEIAERLVAGRLEDSPYADHRFDAICLWDVIEHLWDPVPVVADLMARLKPGGCLFISTPAIDTPVARLSGAYWAFMTPPEHLGFFTRRSFEVLFQRRVPGRVLRFFRRGKWANVAFIGYKIGRIAPRWLPLWLLAPLGWPLVGRLNLYVPTGDVQYLVVRKPDQTSLSGA